LIFSNIRRRNAPWDAVLSALEMLSPTGLIPAHKARLAPLRRAPGVTQILSRAADTSSLGRPEESGWDGGIASAFASEGNGSPHGYRHGA
jgi:hypothetical protein